MENPEKKEKGKRKGGENIYASLRQSFGAHSIAGGGWWGAGKRVLWGLGSSGRTHWRGRKRRKDEFCKVRAKSFWGRDRRRG